LIDNFIYDLDLSLMRQKYAILKPPSVLPHS